MPIELGYLYDGPTSIYENNAFTIMIINAQISTGKTQHIDIHYFAIQYSKENDDIELIFISDVINPVDNLTKPLGCVLYT